MELFQGREQMSFPVEIGNKKKISPEVFMMTDVKRVTFKRIRFCIIHRKVIVARQVNTQLLIKKMNQAIITVVGNNAYQGSCSLIGGIQSVFSRHVVSFL
jgi:hypothetical protein